MSQTKQTQAHFQALERVARKGISTTSPQFRTAYTRAAAEIAAEQQGPQAENFREAQRRCILDGIHPEDRDTYLVAYGAQLCAVQRERSGRSAPPRPAARPVAPPAKVVSIAAGRTQRPPATPAPARKLLNVYVPPATAAPATDEQLLMIHQNEAVVKDIIASMSEADQRTIREGIAGGEKTGRVVVGRLVAAIASGRPRESSSPSPNGSGPATPPKSAA